jgi:ABC-type Fe3+/spermidine/putrescine transport system ATPase subunit
MGTSLRVSSAAACSVGQRGRVMVRPESVRRIARAEEGANFLQGSISEVVFVGAVCKYCVELADGSKVWGKLLSYDPAQAPEPGASVGIGWLVADAVLLPEAAAR